MLEQFLRHFLKYWPYYASLFFAVSAAITIIIVLMVLHRKYDNYTKQMFKMTSFVRTYIVDIKAQIVTTFRFDDLSHPSQLTINEFYNRFPEGDQARVVNWVNAIADPATKTPEFLETDIHDRYSRRRFFSILQLTKVDYEKGLINLDSYAFKNIPLSQGKGDIHGLANPKMLQDAIIANDHHRGATIAFHVAYRRIQDQDNPIDLLHFNMIKNALAPYISSKCILAQYSANDLVLTDLRLKSHGHVEELVVDALKLVQRRLAIEGMLDIFDVRCGIVEHFHYNGDIHKIVETAHKLSMDALAENARYLFFEEGREYLLALQGANFRTEVERIIQENKISILFRPIYAVKRSAVIGYFAKALPINTYFESMDNLYEYALRTGDEQMLFTVIAKNAIPVFMNQAPNPNAKLFYPVRMQSRPHMLKAFAFLKANKNRDVHIVFTFHEDDVKSNIDAAHIDDFIAELRTVKAKGYEIALTFDKGELSLASQIYEIFDYFVCSYAFAGRASEMDGLIRSQLHSMVEKLLKYQRPIIATDIEGWSAIELLIRSSIQYISSDTFAPFDRMILPPPAKSVKRIKDIRD